MSEGRFDAVLFDLDETLIHHRRSDSDAFREAGAAAGFDGVAIEAAVEAASLPIWSAGPEFAYCEAFGISWSEGLAGPFGPSADPRLEGLHRWIPEYRHRAWSEALRCLGHDEELAARLATDFASERLKRIEPYGDAASTLERLRAAGYRLGLLTNGAPDLQRLKIERSGLADLFDVTVISCEVGCGKPDPAIFHLTLDRMGCPADRAAIVGDNPVRDINGGRAAGLFTVLIERGEPEGPVPPDARIRSLTDLPSVL